MRAAVVAGKRSVSEDARMHPKVGALLVKGGHSLAIAYRGELGPGDHAEFTLLYKKLVDVDVTGSTLFTTLEPCTTRKRHKSCADWIIDKGVTSVVIGMLDPNPHIHAQGLRRLRDNGVQVTFFPPPVSAKKSRRTMPRSSRIFTRVLWPMVKLRSTTATTTGNTQSVTVITYSKRDGPRPVTPVFTCTEMTRTSAPSGSPLALARSTR